MVSYNDYVWFTKCQHCGKSLDEIPARGIFRVKRGAAMKYCSYRCINDSFIKRRKERNAQQRKNISCKNCETKFDGSRKDAKFCSSKCRVYYFRKNKNIVTDKGLFNICKVVQQ